jgi:hypothetical protein
LFHQWHSCPFPPSNSAATKLNPWLAYIFSQSSSTFFSSYPIQQHDHSFSQHLNLLPHRLCNILSQFKSEQCKTTAITKPGAALRLTSVQHCRKCRPVISPTRCEPVTSSAAVQLFKAQAFYFQPPALWVHFLPLRLFCLNFFNLI